MARVYLAIQTSLERRVALKVMAPALAADSSFSKRFLREARTIASLTHPHIVAVYEVGVTNDHLHYFSMQFLPGGDFAQRMRKGVEQGEIIRVLTGIAKALGFAHQQGVVHRDVTPGNIMFDAADTPLLTDFGIARALSGSTRITSTGVSIGTSNYMSPEQARGGEVDARSDLYSLGALAFEALTGHPPYQGPDGFAVAYAHVFEPIPRLPQDLAHWQAFIDQALAKDPKDRFASADEFIAALQRVPAAAPPAPRPVAARSAPAPVAASVPVRSASAAIDNLARQVGPAPERSRAVSLPPWARIGLVVVLLAGIGATIYGIWLRPRAAQPPATIDATVPPGKPVSANPVAAPAPPVAAAEPPSTGNLPADAGIAAPVDQVLIPDNPAATDPAGDPSAAPADALALPAPAAEFVVATPEQRIQTFLELGHALLKMQRLLLPAEANAVLFYSRVLALQPENDAARAGLAAVVDAYLALADESLDAGKVAEGKERLDRARQVAQTPGLDSAALIARIDGRWNQRVERLREAARTALLAWKGAEAEAALNQALTLVPRDAEMTQWLAEAKVIGKPGYRFRDGKAGPEMVIVAAGDVLLGGARRGGEVAVKLAQPFAVARREVSVADFRAFVEATRHTVTQEGCRNREGGFFSVSRDRTWREPGFPQGGDHPVVCVGYDDAVAYAKWMAQTTGQKYRLLSEAEWQLLARQVKVKPCASGNRADQSYRKAEGGNGAQSCDDGHAYTAPVGRFEAAAPGLYDIEGNVREWVADCANDSHAGRSPDQAARSSGDCSKRMVMGSAWHSDKNEAATISRRAESRDWLSNTVGFRLARDLAQPVSAQR